MNSILPPEGQRKVVTAWLALALTVGAYAGALLMGAEPNEALDVTLEGLVWVAGLVFAGNVGEHATKLLSKTE